MKLDIRKTGTFKDRIEVSGDPAGIAELRDACISALAGAFVHGAEPEYRIDRAPTGLGETITVRVVGS